jgi:hypothetical protein
MRLEDKGSRFEPDESLGARLEIQLGSPEKSSAEGANGRREKLEIE